ncbi:MAG: flagellar filament capping protein FliD [Armatimonadota bacterium]
MKTDEIITKLMEFGRAPVKRLEAQKASLATKLAAWQEANTRVLALKMKSDALVSGKAFQGRTIATSDSDILTGTVESGAQVGSYSITVNALARAHQTASQGFSDIDSTTVGTGTISIQVGSETAVSVTIDSSNNTLAGLRDAINNSDAGVTASIVNDGSGTPYRLVLASDTCGTEGAITVTPSLAGGTAPAFGTIQAAQNASLTLGSGAGAITVSKSSNTVTDLIPGVTLNLKGADTEKAITVDVQADTASAKQAIQDFIDQYNGLIDFVNKQFAYDPETKVSGTLFTDSNLRSLQSDLRSKISNPVAGLSQSVKLLSQIGISSTNNDKLTINETELDEALSGNGLETVRRVFATVGTAANPSISYLSSTSKTKASGTDGYAVNITAAATQTRITAGTAQTTALAQDENMVVNGIAINLTAGMTQSQVISAINEQSSKTGIIASATDASGTGTGNYLTLKKIPYGTGYSVSVSSNVSNGGGATGVSGFGTVTVTEVSPAGEAGTGTGAAGTDVAGTINGEAATGKGQLLTGDEGNANTDGLQIRVTATSAGSYGNIHFVRGVASVVSQYIDSITQASTGLVMSAQDTVQDQIDFINTEISDYQTRLAAQEDHLIRQFAAMESALGKLQGQGSALSSQIAQASANWKN